MNRRRRGLGPVGWVGPFVAAAALLAGCASGAASSSLEGSVPSTEVAPVAPVGFEAVTVVVTMPDGTTREWCVWAAVDAAQRAQGLMGVTDPELGGRPAMVFEFPSDTTGGFWMKDTLLPLSIAWIDAAGAVVSTADMDPCPADTPVCPSYPPGGPYRLAVEVPQGGLDDLGLVEGARLELGTACV